MNYADLGRKVKEKYPDYSHVADEELGKLVAAKYPEYEAKIDKGNAVTNFLPSLGRVVTDTVDAGVNVFNTDPNQNTITSLGRLLEGVNRKIDKVPVLGEVNRSINPGARAMELAARNNPEAAEFLAPSEQIANAAGQFYKDRYGGIENIKRTINDDPAGALLDLSTILSGGGTLVTKVGKASNLSKLATVGRTAQRIGSAINPIEQAINLPGRAVSAVGSSRAGKALQQPFAGTYDKAIDDLARQYGIDAPVSMTNRSNAVRQAEAIVQKGVFGGKVQEKIQTAANKIGKLADDLTAQVVRNTDLSGAGKDIKKGFEDFQNTFQEQKTVMYEAITPEVRQSPGQFTKTEQALQEIIESKSGSLTPDSNVKYYQDILENIRKKAGDGSGAIDNIKQTRSQIGNKLKNHNDPLATGDTASLKKLYAALSDDLDDSIRALDPELGRQLDEANAYYRETVNKINSRVGKNIANRDPEKLIDDLVKSNSESDVQLVREIIGEEGFQRLQEEFLQKILNKSMKTVVDARGNKVQRLDYDLLTKQLNYYGEPTLQKLFDADQYQRLKTIEAQLADIDKLDRAFKSGTKTANGSQTAYIAEVALIGTTLLQPQIIIPWVVSRMGLRQLFSTERGANLINRGIDVTTPVGTGLQRASRPAGTITRIGNVIGDTQGSEYRDALRRVMERDKTSAQSASLRRLP